MSAHDIRIACDLIASRLPGLRQPATICTRRIKLRSRCLGQYRYLSDTLRLHPRYLAQLDDEQALDLLDTLLHELLHKNSSPLRQLRDTFFAHPDVYSEAARLAKLLAAEFLALRGVARLRPNPLNSRRHRSLPPPAAHPPVAAR